MYYLRGRQQLALDCCASIFSWITLPPISYRPEAVNSPLLTYYPEAVNSPIIPYCPGLVNIRWVSPWPPRAAAAVSVPAEVTSIMLLEPGAVCAHRRAWPPLFTMTTIHQVNKQEPRDTLWFQHSTSPHRPTGVTALCSNLLPYIIRRCITFWFLILFRYLRC